MHFSNFNGNNGSKATKIALVTGLHVLLGIGLIKSMDTKMISLPQPADDITVALPKLVPPTPPPPEPPRPMPKMAPPEVVIPKVEVEVAPPLEQPQVQGTTQAAPEPTPIPAQVQVQADVPPSRPATPTNSGAMRSAVLADANSCAKPAYPANAIRNGDTGTVTLALLVGADGRVSSARVLTGSGSRDLDRAAVNALSLCKFKPAMDGGTPQAGWAQIAYVWSLEQ
ncbi:MAG TPA: energy transducer TonB [Telluria sp.]